MRCFIKGSGAGPLVQFTHHSEDKNDPGDGGGIAVFSFWPLSYFEKLARELVEMFALEISFKRLIVLQLLSISCLEAPRAQTDRISWSSELYQGEFDGLNMIDLLCKEKCQPIPPRIKDFRSDNPLTEQVNHDPDREVLQVYLTAWILEVNVDTKRYSTPSCESFDVEPEPVKILARSLAPSLALAISKLMDKLVVMMMNLAASNKFSSWKRYGLLLVLYQVSILLVCNHSSACIRLPLGNLRRCF
uniref:Cyclin-dependent kinase 2-interacting protein n=1 Tax=Anthurium amnicola TaxID=1678845 RepID=A0A1D1ZGC1_9ARAE